jgi:phospholipid transport system substrate-binding protein
MTSMKTSSRRLFTLRGFVTVMTMTAAITISLSQSRFVIPARAQANSPMAVVQSTVNQSLDVLRDKQAPLPERQQKLRQIVSGTFDFTEMAKSALGYHWKQLSPEQQQEFTNTFISFIEDSYLSKINDYRGQQVSFLRANSDGPDEAQVNTDIVQQGKDPIHVNYRLVPKGGTWKIYDVTVDAISIIANYRNQFDRVMNNQGYDTLIKDLKSKQAALEQRLGNQ